ncbi:MAG: GNAT family N-acetyltransferase [Bryobacterales bacterium]|nr:GNAT family N-acetyltransferase [Bryobacterales bacterium]
MTPGIEVRPVRPEDCQALVGLRAALWPDCPLEEHVSEIEGQASGAGPYPFPTVLLVAVTENGEVVGFLEADLRSHADGCDATIPVGYIEGWFVAEAYRGRGAGRKLVAAAEQWARELGCVEMASDTWIDNEGSILAHRALGFEEVDRCVNFRKKL